MDMKRCPAGRTGLPVSAYHTCATRAIKTTAKKTLPINAHLPTDTLRWSQKGPHSDFHTVCRSPPRRTSTTCTAQAARCSTALGSSMKGSAAPRRKSARSVSVGSARTALVASRPVRSAVGDPVVVAAMRPHRERRPPAPFQTGGRQQGKSTGRTKPSAGDKGGSSPDGAPRKYKTSGASHMPCSPQQPAGQVLKPNNAPVTTECINRIEANAKWVGLARAIGIESISKSGYYKALRRIKRDGHATPPRPRVAPGRKRTYPLFSPEFASCRKYLEEDEPDLSYREAALNVVPPSSAANLCRTFGNGSADSNARSKKGLRSTQAGLKPLTSKKCQIVMSETNMPRILDMFLSWHNSVKQLRTLRRSWTDESKIKYGHGQHGPKGSCMENKSCITWSHAQSRWKQSTESPLGAPGAARSAACAVLCAPRWYCTRRLSPCACPAPSSTARCPPAAHASSGARYVDDRHELNWIRHPSCFHVPRIRPPGRSSILGSPSRTKFAAGGCAARVRHTRRI